MGLYTLHPSITVYTLLIRPMILTRCLLAAGTVLEVRDEPRGRDKIIAQEIVC